MVATPSTCRPRGIGNSVLTETWIPLSHRALQLLASLAGAERHEPVLQEPVRVAVRNRQSAGWRRRRPPCLFAPWLSGRSWSVSVVSAVGSSQQLSLGRDSQPPDDDFVASAGVRAHLYFGRSADTQTETLPLGHSWTRRAPKSETAGL